MPDIFHSRFLEQEEDLVMIPDAVLPEIPEESEEPDEPQIDPIEQLRKELTTEIEQKLRASLTPQIEHEAEQRIFAEHQQQMHEECLRATEKAYTDIAREERGKIRQCMENVENTLLLMQQQQEQFAKGYAEKLPQLSVEIANKVMLSKINENDAAMKSLVSAAVQSVKSAPWIRVEVSSKLSSLVKELRESFAIYGERLEIRTNDEAPKDFCRVSTAQGVIDAGVSTQIKNIQKAFSQIDEQEGTEK